MKRVIAIVLMAAMMLVFASCSSGSNQAATTSTATTQVATASTATSTGPDTSKFVELTWMYEGSAVVDDSAVMEKVNAYLKDKLNCKLTMKWESWGDFDNKETLAINGGDPVDIYFTSGWNAMEYTAMAKKGAFVRLDDPSNNILQKDAPDLFKTIPQVLSDAAMVKGANGMGVYAIPTYKEIAQQYVWNFNMPILQKYGITPDQVTDLKSLAPLLEKIKKGEGKDFYPINSDYTVWARANTNTDMIDANMLLDYTFDPAHPAQSTSVINSRFENPTFAAYAATMRDYFQKGYVNPAATTNADAMNQTWTNTLKSGKWAFEIYPYYPGYENTQTSQYKYQFAVKPVQAGIISSTSSRGAMNAVSVTSKNPDRALMLLNLVNTDPTLRTLLTDGVEGVQYTKDSNGRVTFTAKKNDYGVWAAGLGNITILPLQATDPANLYTELFPKFNNAEALPILGYSFDQDPVKTQMASLNNLEKQYGLGLFTGASDPAKTLPEFTQKLKAAGIDDVVKEANNQMQTFLSDKKAK